MKQVKQFSRAVQESSSSPLIDIPTQGQQFLFEKFLIVDEVPYVKGKYGQYLGDDIFLFVPSSPGEWGAGQERRDPSREMLKQQIVPNVY